MDRVTKFLAHEGRVSLICANTTDLVEEIRKIHDLTPTTTAAMGRFATISGMMGLTEIKEQGQSITIQMNGQGPMGTLISVVKRVDNVSKVKVCTDNPQVELPLKEDGKLDVGGAVGNNGFLNIINKNEVTDKDYTGLVPIVSGEIAEDFTEYFAKSQQKPTVIALGVLVNKDGVKSAGGYMIQLMPDATEEDIVQIENALNNAPSISQMISENKSLEEIAMTISGDENIMILAQELKMEYECDCNKEKFERGLISIGKKELQKIIDEDGKADTICHFCNKEYHFTKEELEDILNKM
jgi:molecular chaperone Hsp33